MIDFPIRTPRCKQFFTWPAMRVISLGIRTVPASSVGKKLAAQRPTSTAPAEKCGPGRMKRTVDSVQKKFVLLLRLSSPLEVIPG